MKGIEMPLTKSNFLRGTVGCSVALAVALSVATSPATAVDKALPAGIMMPATIAKSFTATLTASGDTSQTTQINWRGQNQWSAITEYSGSSGTEYQIDTGTRRLNSWTNDQGQGDYYSTESNMIHSQPDGYRLGEGLAGYMQGNFALSRARTKNATVTSTTINGQNAFKVTWKVPANDCAGKKKGVRTVMLASDTLLPLKVVETRGSKTESIDISYSGINNVIEDTVFVFPDPTGIKPADDVDQGFKSQKLTSRNKWVKFKPRYPRWVPSGFEEGTFGWRKMSSSVGPEASIAPVKGFVAASWWRGAEQLDMTIRSARPQITLDWGELSPFGGECLHIDTRDVSINGGTGTISTSPDGLTAVWWQRGRALYTLYGPLSGREMLKIARSIR